MFTSSSLHAAVHQHHGASEQATRADRGQQPGVAILATLLGWARQATGTCHRAATAAVQPKQE